MFIDFKSILYMAPNLRGILPSAMLPTLLNKRDLYMAPNFIRGFFSSQTEREKLDDHALKNKNV